ncbi:MULTISPECIES: FHA domain-containing protein [unclassified Nocardiopsis]|uniref:FHA domain-containing protein n=1 Tax=Nocardiopsis TaxID=2013 RepID=UPI00387ACF9D
MATYRCQVTPDACPVRTRPGYCPNHMHHELVPDPPPGARDGDGAQAAGEEPEGLGHEDSGEVQPPRYWSLRIPALGRPLVIPAEGLLVGRDAPAFADVSEIHDLIPNVSRDHAHLEWREDTLFLTDRGSSFGTFVDGRPLTEGVPVEVGPDHLIRFAQDVSARIIDDDL